MFVAQPWWVNLLALIPVACFLFWWRGSNPLPLKQLWFGAVFAVAFGFLEAAVVVYLRAATGLLPEAGGGVLHAAALYQQTQLLNGMPKHLLRIEVMRETTTMVMLAGVAFLASSRARARWAMFFWTFAIWDITYYAGLWTLLRWPASLRETDVLFLIPVPWMAPVWFPVIVSGLMIAVVLLTKGTSETRPPPKCRWENLRKKLVLRGILVVVGSAMGLPLIPSGGTRNPVVYPTASAPRD